jgi:hypothetical protein
MAKTPTPPQVPGETPPAADPATPASDAPDEIVEVPKAQLDALLARVAALETAAPVARRANPDADLPHQDDVDPATIKSPVLSKQGWIVPTGHGSNPNAPK